MARQNKVEMGSESKREKAPQKVLSCPSWQWHRSGSCWSPVRTLPVAPLTWDSSRTVVVIQLRRTPAPSARQQRGSKARGQIGHGGSHDGSHGGIHCGNHDRGYGGSDCRSQRGCRSRRYSPSRVASAHLMDRSGAGRAQESGPQCSGRQAARARRPSKTAHRPQGGHGTESAAPGVRPRQPRRPPARARRAVTVDHVYY